MNDPKEKQKHAIDVLMHHRESVENADVQDKPAITYLVC